MSTIYIHACNIDVHLWLSGLIEEPKFKIGVTDTIIVGSMLHSIVMHLNSKKVYSAQGEKEGACMHVMYSQFKLFLQQQK